MTLRVVDATGQLKLQHSSLRSEYELLEFANSFRVFVAGHDKLLPKVFPDHLRQQS